MLHEMNKTLVVGEDLEREGPMEVVTPGLERVDDGQELALMRWIVDFGGRALA